MDSFRGKFLSEVDSWRVVDVDRDADDCAAPMHAARVGTDFIVPMGFHLDLGQSQHCLIRRGCWAFLSRLSTALGSANEQRWFPIGAPISNSARCFTLIFNTPSTRTSFFREARPVV